MSDIISKHGTTSDKPSSAVLLFYEQFASSVVDFTSKYNSRLGISYAPDNLIGTPMQYPNYGDFADTYMLRSYGNWWKESKGFQKNYMSHDTEDIVSEDYVTVRFEQPVWPVSIFIYETYNPGVVVRIWGRNSTSRFDTIKWYLMYEGPPEIYEKSARKFNPQLLPISDIIDELRIDFNQSLSEYHTSLDAVHLAGYIIKTPMQLALLQKLKVTSDQIDVDFDEDIVVDVDESRAYVENLPYEVLIHIFSYLDFKSLGRSAQVSRKWRDICVDPSMYQEISLKKYWHKISDETIFHFLNLCRFVKKLDLSWCNTRLNLTEKAVVRFLENCCIHLTHLALNNCHFVQEDTIKAVGNCRELIDLRLRFVASRVRSSVDWFRPLAQLNQLVAIDLCYTNIETDVLMLILKANPHLQHIYLDFCEDINSFDEVTRTLSVYNRKLITFSAWKTKSLTEDGVKYLTNCSNLEEIDLGWCMVTTDVGGSLSCIAQGCPHLKRLILSGWRGISDHLLLPVIRSCKHLRQLDLLGIHNISGDIVERILDSLTDLRLLDISFCDSIMTDQVEVWRNVYPLVTIHRSCGTVAVM